MQKLEDRNTYTPTDAPQVCSNCDPILNKDLTKQETVSSLGVLGLKTSSNNSEVDKPEHEEQNLLKPKKSKQLSVFVLNKKGKVLMPTSPAKAKHLLKNGKAKVVKRTPFTIQLNYNCGERTQHIKLGIDAAYKTIGFSARTDKKELVSGEVILRTDIPDKILEKSMYRRGRRNRNTWYRPARWMNRGNADGKKAGWLAPSIEHKLDSHIRLVNEIYQILPITDIKVEVATFDTQKMQNPEISGIEYQQGTLQGYEIREYLLEKFRRKCVYCGKIDVPLEVEHVIPPLRKGGSDRVSNLAIACHECNQKKGNRTAAEFGHPEVMEQCKKPLKDATFMNIVRWKMIERLKDQFEKIGITVDHTYGYITKKNRIELGLEKSHVNDAFVISEGTNQKRCKPYTVKQNRRNNRALQLNRKGHKPSIRRVRYKLQPNDIVRFEDKECTVKGMFNKGAYVRLVDKLGNIINTNIKNVKLITFGKGLQFLVGIESITKIVKKSVKTIKETKKEVIKKVETYMNLLGDVMTKEVKTKRTYTKKTRIDYGQSSLFNY